MGTIAVIGESVRTIGFGLAGAIVFECESPAQVRHAWEALPDDVLTVILTPAAQAALVPSRLAEAGRPFVVMPS